MKKGKITPNGVVLHTHENASVVFLTEQGFDVELLPPVQRKGARTPDIKILDLEWEIKSPKSNGKYTIEHSFRSALKQSPNIIFDIRGSKMPQQKCIAEIERRFNDFKKVNRVMIITKRNGLLDFNKKI
ncbi:MAG: hypothetical protein WAT17_00010 [Candidatus Saccharimonadales bacterium]|jgi:hypothetical protein